MLTKLLTFTLLSTTAILTLVPQTGEAACFLNCRCSDRTGYGVSRSYGPFNSTAACNAAVSSFTMQCKSGNQAHWFTASCSPGCFNCEPPAPPKNTSTKQDAPASTQQPDWDAYRKAQEAKEQQQFQLDIDKLKLQMKDGAEINGSNDIKLKAPPSESALRQLECAGEQSRPGNVEEHGKDWTHSSACNTPLPDAPKVPNPAAAESKGGISRIQLDLQHHIAVTREKLVQQDNQIVQLEQTVKTEEAKKTEPDKGTPAGESDALRKAREALAKAKAERARTASELAKLEKQEAANETDKH